MAGVIYIENPFLRVMDEVGKRIGEGLLQAYKERVLRRKLEEFMNELSDQYKQTGIPTLHDVLLSKQYGVNLPTTTTTYKQIGGSLFEIRTTPWGGTEIKEVAKKAPKVAGFRLIDTGDKLIPFVLMDNGEAVIPAQYVKKLSPYQREVLRQHAKELNLKIRKLKNQEDWQNFQKWVAQKELELKQKRLNLEQQKVDLLKEKETQPQPPSMIDIEKEAYSLLAKRYRISKDPITGQYKIQDIMGGREVSPEEFRQVFEQTKERILREKYPQYYSTWEFQELNNLPASQPQPQTQPQSVNATKLLESITGIRIGK